MVEHAVKSGLEGEAGVVGHDEEHQGRLRVIEFSRIRGGKKFDIGTPAFARSARGLSGNPWAPGLQPTAAVEH